MVGILRSRLCWGGSNFNIFTHYSLNCFNPPGRKGAFSWPQNCFELHRTAWMISFRIHLTPPKRLSSDRNPPYIKTARPSIYLTTCKHKSRNGSGIKWSVKDYYLPNSVRELFDVLGVEATRKSLSRHNELSKYWQNNILG